MSGLIEKLSKDLGEGLDHVYSGLRDFLGGDLPERSSGWELQIEPRSIELAEGAKATVNLTVSRGQAPGTAFAIAAYDRQHPDRSFYSDVMVATLSKENEIALRFAEDVADDDHPETLTW